MLVYPNKETQLTMQMDEELTLVLNSQEKEVNFYQMLSLNLGKAIPDVEVSTPDNGSTVIVKNITLEKYFLGAIRCIVQDDTDGGVVSAYGLLTLKRFEDVIGYIENNYQHHHENITRLIYESLLKPTMVAVKKTDGGITSFATDDVEELATIYMLCERGYVFDETSCQVPLFNHLVMFTGEQHAKAVLSAANGVMRDNNLLPDVHDQTLQEAYMALLSINIFYPNLLSK